jgi:hypothetical protein
MVSRKNITPSNGSRNIMLFLAVFVLVVSGLNAVVTFVKVSDYNNKVTGYAANIGYVNLTISSTVIINVSQDATNWGPGIVNQSNNATLQTNRNVAGTVARGNWSTATARALIVQNLGTVNVTLNVSSNVNNSDFIPTGTLARKRFWYNFTNRDTNACNYSSQTTTSAWYNVSKNAQIVCDKMRYGTGVREIWVDTLIMVPDDATASINSATFTFTGTAIAD